MALLYLVNIIFVTSFGPDAEQILSTALAVETAVFSVGKRTDQAYKTKIRSLYLNLKDKKNPNLRRRVINGEISPERISTMTSQEMASEERRAEDQKLERENMREAMKPTAVRSTTDQFPCGKCGKRTVAYSQAQTRSADEPMTTFCECVRCFLDYSFKLQPPALATIRLANYLLRYSKIVVTGGSSVDWSIVHPKAFIFIMYEYITLGVYPLSLSLEPCPTASLHVWRKWWG